MVKHSISVLGISSSNCIAFTRSGIKSHLVFISIHNVCFLFLQLVGVVAAAVGLPVVAVAAELLSVAADMLSISVAADMLSIAVAIAVAVGTMERKTIDIIQWTITKVNSLFFYLNFLFRVCFNFIMPINELLAWPGLFSFIRSFISFF